MKIGLLGLLLGICLIVSSGYSAEAFDTQKVISKIQQQQNAIQDMTIEFTTICRLYGTKEKEELTPAEKKKIEERPGRYKPETGKLIIKGNKMRLDMEGYFHAHENSKWTSTKIYNGTVTFCVRDVDKGQRTAKILPGIWHGFQLGLTPWSVMSVNGKTNCGDELIQLCSSGQIEPDASGTLMNGTIKVKATDTIKKEEYTQKKYEASWDTANGNNLKKVSKYCPPDNLKQVITVNAYKEYSAGLIMPEKVLSVRYMAGSPVEEHELEITSVVCNSGVLDEIFKFPLEPNLTVWDETIRMSYKVNENPDLVPIESK